MNMGEKIMNYLYSSCHSLDSEIVEIFCITKKIIMGINQIACDSDLEPFQEFILSDNSKIYFNESEHYWLEECDIAVKEVE